MKEINFTELLRRQGKLEVAHGYELLESEKYFIKYTRDFFQYNTNVALTIEMLGGISHPDCLRVVKDFNAFMKSLKNMSFKNVQQFLQSKWGKQFLWDNEFTRGIVVKVVEPDDLNDFRFDVLIECSRECTGFKYTKFVASDSYTQKAVAEVLENVSATN